VMEYNQEATGDKFKHIAEAMGVRDEYLDGKDQEGWTREIYETAAAKDPRMPSYEEGYEIGEFHYRNPKGYTPALATFVADPVANPLKTPSGKIEVYSEKILADTAHFVLRDDEVISPLPVYAPLTFEPGTADRERFPLQLIGYHHRSRAHSSYGSLDAIK